MYKHILAATDGTELPAKALHHAFSLAKALGANISVVTVTEAWETLAIGFAAQNRTAQ